MTSLPQLQLLIHDLFATLVLIFVVLKQLLYNKEKLKPALSLPAQRYARAAYAIAILLSVCL